MAMPLDLAGKFGSPACVWFLNGSVFIVYLILFILCRIPADERRDGREH